MCNSTADALVSLEPACWQNVDLLIRWTLDPVAQGPYKRVPDDSPAALRELFLSSPDRRYYLIRRSADGKPLGRFYERAWHFDADPTRIDWELNIFIADPAERGKGYGTCCQERAAQRLLAESTTRSVFAYTLVDNHAERRALLKADFTEIGPLPHPAYPIATVPRQPSILYVQSPTR